MKTATQSTEKKIDKSNLEDILELTPFQEGLLLHYIQNETSQYTEQLYLKVSGKIDQQRFRDVWQHITDKNEVLRSFFRWKAIKKPVIIVLKKYEPVIEYVDLTGIPAGDRADKIRAIRSEDIKRTFDLSEVPFRIKLIQLEADSHVLLVSNHHILYDGWSTGIILKEFFQAFDGAHLENGSDLTSKKARYKDYVIWNQRRDKQADEAFWKKYLSRRGDVTRLPFANPKRDAVTSVDSGKRTHVFDIEQSLYEQIQEYSKSHNVTVANLLYSAWSLLLSQFNDDPVVFGTTVSCRPNKLIGVENTVGLFINTVPMTCDIRSEMTLNEVLNSNQASLHEREPFESSSLTDIYEHINAEDSRLFDSIVVIENYPIDKVLSENSSDLRLEDHHMDYLTHYLLSLVISTFDGIHVTFTFNEQIFSETAIQLIEAYFLSVLKEIVHNPNKQVGQLYLISEKERAARISAPFNISPSSDGHTIRERFEHQAKLSPSSKAIKSGDLEVTYEQLDQKANGLSNSMVVEGLEAKDTVVLYFDNSPELVTSMLACLKTNATFLTIAPDTPIERVQYILDDSGASLLLTHPKFEKHLKNDLSYDHIVSCEFDKIEPHNEPTTGVGAIHDLAYIIYTSGTTGAPKGVMIEDASLMNYVNVAIDTYTGNEVTSFPLFTSPAFDLTLTSVFVPLLSGGSIVVYAGEQKDFLIEKVFDEDLVDVIKLTPSHLKLIRERFKDGNATFSSQIKRFIVGGEQLTADLAADITDLYGGNVEIYNEYGPTEATIGCMIYPYQRETDNRLSVPVGKVIANNWVYVLDEELQPVISGATGEMYVSGLGLARGYVNNNALTSDRFITNPFKPSERMYKTGDLARWLPDGNLEYIGRNDKQVKVRGYRIELEEVENALLQYGAKGDTNDNFSIVESTKTLEKLQRCTKCLLPENYPGISFDHKGVCNICNEFEEYKAQIDSYFRTEEDFLPVVEEMKSVDSEYDCLLLYSGGKDSTFVLHKLMDYGLKVLTYTFDNGYISDTAFKNIRATTEKLGILNIKISTPKMRKVFSESLRTNCSACHGCWHAINTFGIQLAKKHNIKHIVSGLSRGQIYDMRLEGIFETRVFEENKIEEQLAIFRQSFHSGSNKYSKLLKVSVPPGAMEGMQFVDFFRYYTTPVREIKAYLLSKGWIQPKDTGFCSSNCLINDVGVYTHIKEKGYNFYTAPLSWDVRLGATSRQEGLEEVTAFGSTEEHVHTVLKEIDYTRSLLIREAIVLKNEDGDKESLVAYIVSDLPPIIPELRTYLKDKLPDYMIPSHFIQIEKIPLNANGKLDVKSLPKISKDRPRLQNEYVLPSSAYEQKVAEICKEVLGIDIIGTNDNLFDLGATSFDLTRITNKLNEAFEKKISVTLLFTFTSIKDLAAYFSGPKPNEVVSDQKTVKKPGSKLAQRRTLLKRS